MTEEDKKQNTTQDLCEAISAYWTKQEDPDIVQTYGLLLKKATDEGHYLTLQKASEDQSSIPKDDFGRYVQCTGFTKKFLIAYWTIVESELCTNRSARFQISFDMVDKSCCDTL